MATLKAYQYLTANDVAQQMGLGSSQVMVIECLTAVNSFIQDAYWEEANEVLSNRGLRALNLPAASWRRLNAGVSYEMSKEVPYADVIGMLETRCKCDAVLAKAWPGGVAAYRNSRARRFIEGMSQTVSTAILYANAGVDTEQMTGLAPRMATLKTDHVISAGGSTASTVSSIYIIQWGPERAKLVYPRGSQGLGIQHTPLAADGPDGARDLVDDNSLKYRGYEDHFAIHFGLVVDDERCIKRICNHEVTGQSNIFDENLLIQALEEMPYEGQGATIYCNKTIRRQMRVALKDKQNLLWSSDQALGGKKILMFDEYPVKRSDAILNTEEVVTS